MDVPEYDRIIHTIARSADPEPVIEDIRIYTNWVLVKTGTWALSTIFRGMPGLYDHQGMDTWMGDWLGRPGLESARELLSSRETLRRAVGMACLKSLLPRPSNSHPGSTIELFKEASATVPTCFIGYFKVAAEWRDKGYPVTIVELFPRPGDVHWNDADGVLAEAQIVLMSGLTLVNETLPAVIRRTSSAQIRVMIGPTVPPSPVLFECGIDMLGVTLVDNWKSMARYAELGGGSIAHSPHGALEKITMVEDRASLHHTLATLAASSDGKT